MKNRTFSAVLSLSLLFLALFTFAQSVNGSETPYFSVIRVRRIHYAGDFPGGAAFPYGYMFNITLKNVGDYASSVAAAIFVDFENQTTPSSTTYLYSWNAGEERSIGVGFSWLNQSAVPANTWIKLEVTAVQTQVFLIYFDVVIDVSVSPGELDYPQEVTINGKLRNTTSGAGIPNQDMRLYLNEALVANIKTDADGNFTYVLVPPYGVNRIRVVWSFWEDCIGSTYVTVQARTSLSISLSSSTTYIGFKVNISGKLTYLNGTGVSGFSILLSYSVTGGQSWSDITSTNTATDGGYTAQWIPSATGIYLVRATWTGHEPVLGANVTINLAVAQFAEQYVFSVLSNSTVSSLAFNSIGRELSFSVSGPPGTNGYVNVTIAKSLIPDIANLKVYLNGTEISCTVSPTDDSWLLRFTYHHSTNSIRISLGLQGKVPLTTPFFGVKMILAVAALTLSAALVSAYFLKLRKRKH